MGLRDEGSKIHAVRIDLKSTRREEEGQARREESQKNKSPVNIGHVNKQAD